MRRTPRWITGIAMLAALNAHPAASVASASPATSPPAASFEASASERERQGGTTLWAQDRGFSIGAALHTNVLGVDDPGPDAEPDELVIDQVGVGLMLVLGYAFTPNFDLRASLGSARHGTSQPGINALHATISFEGRYRFLAQERARPYLLGGIGGTSVTVETDAFKVEVRGAAAVMAMGFELNLTRHFVLDLATRLDLINWNEIGVDAGLPDGTAVRLEQAIEGSTHAAKFLIGAGWQF